MGAVMNDRIARTLETLAATTADGDSVFLGELCQRMLGATGTYEPWGAVCRAKDIPQGKVMEWLRADAARYANFHQALQLQRELLADDAAAGVDEIVEIADNTGPDEVGVSKLRVSARKDRAEFRTQLAAVMTPERYGRVRKVEDAPSALPDAALLGFASDLLRLVAERGAAPQGSAGPRDITGESLVIADKAVL